MSSILLVKSHAQSVMLLLDLKMEFVKILLKLLVVLINNISITIPKNVNIVSMQLLDVIFVHHNINVQNVKHNMLSILSVDVN